MFERYTERARRALFFARYCANSVSSESIEPEHLLVGLLRESTHGLLGRIFANRQLPLDDHIRELVGAHVEPTFRHGVLEIPVSGASKRVLSHAADESMLLHHDEIGDVHLLLGVFNEESSRAAAFLTKMGLSLPSVRRDLVEMIAEQAKVTVTAIHPEPSTDHQPSGWVRVARTTSGHDTVRQVLTTPHRLSAVAVAVEGLF